MNSLNPRTPSNPDDTKNHKSACRLSISVLDKAVLQSNIRSYFSDEDSKSDDDNNEDILQLANQEDKLKASRNDLILRLTSQQALSVIKESDVAFASPNQSCLEKTQEPMQLNELYPRLDSRQNSRPAAGDDSEVTPDENGQMEFSGVEYSEDLEELEDIDEKYEPAASDIPKPMQHHFKYEVETSNPKAAEAGDGRFKNPFKSQNPSPIVVQNLPIMEGRLKKKSTNMLHRWQERFFVLNNRKLYYYKTEEKGIMSGCIDFDLITVKLVEGKDKRRFKIIPVGSQRMFYLKAANDELGQSWFEAVRKNIEASRGHLVELNKTSTVKRFWKFDRISEDRFLDQVDTGDILLFKTKKLGAKLQRSFTRSEYDHVGLILRYSSGEIVLFEATGKTGVGLCRWKMFMRCKWHLLYSRIVYRKLAVPKTDEIVNGIAKFVRNSLGKKFGVSASKLLRKKSLSHEEEIQDNRTFFCSELVAACYKKIGLLPKEISAAYYLPGSFAAEKKLELANGAKLEDEMLIDFNI